MIIQSLIQHYEDLLAKDIIAPLGWTASNMSFGLQLDPQGDIIALLPLGLPEVNGKGIVAQQRILPAPVKRAIGIAPNFLWDNSSYIFGFDGKGKPLRTNQCFEASKLFHLSLLENISDPFAEAVCSFFRSWDTRRAREHPLIKPFLREAGLWGNIVFMQGILFADQNEALRDAWENYYYGENEYGTPMRDLASGRLAIPAATHPSIKNVRGSLPSGAALVSFNAPAFCSHGHKRNLNAPVSQHSAFAYTSALNYLLTDNAHRHYVGDDTIVCWAEGAEQAPQSIFSLALGAEEGYDASEATDIRATLHKLASGETIIWNNEPVNPDRQFYVLGLSPNSARISVRLFHQDRFGEILNNLQRHFDELEIVKPVRVQRSLLPLCAVLNGATRSHRTANPRMAGDTLRAILMGTKYPSTLYQAVLNRIFADKDISYARASIIKAYLLRNAGLEVCQNGSLIRLNEDITYQPYVLGRLFSLLEDLLYETSGNYTPRIMAKYLRSACMTPALAFPTLIKMAEKRSRFLPNGKHTFPEWNNILKKFIPTNYASHHSLHDQGVFLLGYYHQSFERNEKGIDQRR